MDMNVKVPGIVDVGIKVPAIEKLVDYTASGIGSIAGPMLAPWRASRKAQAKLIAAKGDAEKLKILAEGQSSALQTIANAQADARRRLESSDITIQGELTITEMVEQRIQFQEEKRLGNIGSTVSFAAEDLKGKEVPDHEPDHDLMARFFSEVQDVSSEELQKLWAKVLSGEVERPGTTSIRSLTILRNLDQNTARLFRKFCSVCVSIRMPDEIQFMDARVPSLNGHAAQNALKQYGLTFDALNVLNEHGLIISDYNSWFDYNACIRLHTSEPKKDIWCLPFGFQDRYWVLLPTTKRAVDQELRLTGVALTKSGRELSRIADIEPMDEYTQALIKFFEGHNLQMIEVDNGELQLA